MDFFEKRSDYSLCIPVLNEGERIRIQLKRLEVFAKSIDIVIIDGGSTNDPPDPAFLAAQGVRTLLIRPQTPGLGAQLKLGFQYVLDQGYKGCVLIDGNGKDDPEAIPRFVASLEAGFDFIQGSRFIAGGRGVNTPAVRNAAIRLLHAPLLSLASGIRYTDTTNGFRAYSRRFLIDPRILPSLDPSLPLYDRYELHYFLAMQAGLQFKVREIPVTRTYPANGKIPTKISFFRGNFNVLIALLKVCLSRRNT